MEMYNADGSRGEMCGNGIRCVAKYVYERGLARVSPLRVETDAGVKTLWLVVRDGEVESVTVDMGEPVLEGSLIPVAAEGEIVDHPLTVDGGEYRVTCVSMGNPHCVVFTDGIASLAVEAIGPRFERHPFFPRGVNAEFVEVAGRRRLFARVWERGSGETAACGTGACAAVVAGVRTGRSERRVTVTLRGGDLEIEWREADNRVYMTGGAQHVFEGVLEL